MGFTAWLRGGLKYAEGGMCHLLMLGGKYMVHKGEVKCAAQINAMGFSMKLQEPTWTTSKH